MSTLISHQTGSTATLTDLASSINDEHVKAQKHWEKAVEHAVKVGELLTHAKSQVEHGEWLPWLEANCAFSKRMAQNYVRLAKELPKLDTEKAQRVSHLNLRDAVRSIASTSKVLHTLPEERVDTVLQAAEDHANTNVYRGAINAKRQAAREADALRIKNPGPPPLDDGSRQVTVRREEGKDEGKLPGRPIWSIRTGPNEEGIHLQEHLDVLEAEPEFAERRAEIDRQMEQVKELRERADRLKEEAYEKRRHLGHDLQVEAVLRYGWPSPVAEVRHFCVSPEFDAELSASEQPIDVLRRAERVADPRIEGHSEGWNGDTKWFSYVWVPAEVRERLGVS